MSWLTRLIHKAPTPETKATKSDELVIEIDDPLLEAVRIAETENVAELLGGGASANLLDEMGESILMKASINGHADIVELLLEHGADPDISSEYGTALMYAAQGGREEIVRQLVAAGADINLRAPVNGWTAVDGAEATGHFEIAQFLRTAGGAEHSSPADHLEGAAWSINPERIKHHLGRCDAVDSDILGRALVAAAAAGQCDFDSSVEIARLLIEAGADANYRDAEAKTPLIFATANRNVELVRMLTEHGANPTYDGFHGTSPLSMAQAGGDAESREILQILAPAPVEMVDQAGAVNIEVNVEDLRAICVGFVNVTPSQEDAFQLGFDLMERWNQKVYESFKQRQPNATVRVFGAPTLDRLSYDLAAARNNDYAECLAILQTGSFDTYQRSTGSHIKAEVILATFWQTGSEGKTLIAAGSELTLFPVESASDPKVPQGRDADLSAQSQISALVATLRQVMGRHSGEVRTDTGVNILRFPLGREQHYELNLKLTERLKSDGVYPELHVHALRAALPAASFARLIVLTGSADAAGRLADTFYTPQAEEFVAAECAGKWDAINPASSISNIADLGMSLDVEGFSRDLSMLLGEIESGVYEIERVLD